LRCTRLLRATDTCYILFSIHYINPDLTSSFRLSMVSLVLSSTMHDSMNVVTAEINTGRLMRIDYVSNLISMELITLDATCLLVTPYRKMNRGIYTHTVITRRRNRWIVCIFMAQNPLMPIQTPPFVLLLSSSTTATATMHGGGRDPSPEKQARRDTTPSHSRRPLYKYQAGAAIIHSRLTKALLTTERYNA
jgi:hypothetical protein